MLERVWRWLVQYSEQQKVLQWVTKSAHVSVQG
jgi:hypothetical protein